MDGHETEILSGRRSAAPPRSQFACLSRHLNFLTDNTGAISQERTLAEEEPN